MEGDNRTAPLDILCAKLRMSVNNMIMRPVFSPNLELGTHSGSAFGQPIVHIFYCNSYSTLVHRLIPRYIITLRGCNFKLVADPGFPREVRQPPPGEGVHQPSIFQSFGQKCVKMKEIALTYYLPKFLPKCVKMKEIAPRGPTPPPDNLILQ